MSKHHIPLMPGETYHLFNRAVGNEKLFRTSENYLLFLDRFDKHTFSICDTFTYCLLPNHFHFLIRVKDEHLIRKHYQSVKHRTIPLYDNATLSDFIMERFSNWLNSYTKSYNGMFQRKGALFPDYTKRSLVSNDNSFSKVIHYIHANPVHHGYCDHLESWEYSSYQTLLSNLPTDLLRNEVIDWFGSKEAFIEFHQQPVEMKTITNF